MRRVNWDAVVAVALLAPPILAVLFKIAASVF